MAEPSFARWPPAAPAVAAAPAYGDGLGLDLDLGGLGPWPGASRASGVPGAATASSIRVRGASRAGGVDGAAPPASAPRQGQGGSGGQVQFPCDQCGKVYLHPPSLWNHKSFQCGKQPQFSCSVCGKHFWFNAHRKRHLLRVHGQTEPSLPNRAGRANFKARQPQ